METYLVYVIEDLVITAVLAGIVFSYARSWWGNYGERVATIGIIAGLAAAVVMAILKQHTALISTRIWNTWIFSLSLILAIAALVGVIVRSIATRKHKEDGSALARKAGYVVLFALVGFVALRIFYKAPDVVNYPANFAVSSGNLISTDFAVRITGWLLGIVVCVITYVATLKACKALEGRSIGIVTAIIVLVICFTQSMSLFQILISRRFITRGTVLYSILFPLTTWVYNHSAMFTLAIMIAVVVLMVIIILLSLRDAEPYANPAEHRKNKAKWRNRRRWAACLIACLAVSFVCVTVVKDYMERGPVIVESEECEIRDDGMYIPLELISDGHLHRFTFVTTEGYTTSTGYETQGGIGVRVIAIKKPGGNAYGIGLDACDICGTTGYYERDGKVVCSKCDVVMNINTIGFKGGCNPIVIAYTIENGYVFIAKEALLEYEKIPGATW